VPPNVSADRLRPIPLPIAATIGGGILLVVLAGLIPSLVHLGEELALIAILAALYLGPALVAFLRHHPSRLGIAVLNLLLGWTFIGWIAALVWAFSDNRDREPIVVHNTVSPTISVGAPERHAG
jgi:T4 superinfection immunity protein